MLAAKTRKNNTFSSVQAANNNLFFQPKLEVGKPTDRYEVEAERTADRVVAQGFLNEGNESFFKPNSQVQQKVEDEPKNKIQGKPLIEGISTLVQTKADNSKVEELEPGETDVQAKLEEEPKHLDNLGEIQKKEDELIESEEEVSEVQAKIEETSETSGNEHITHPLNEKVQKQEEEISETEESVFEVQAKVEEQTESLKPKNVETQFSISEVQKAEEENSELEEEEVIVQEKSFLQKREDPEIKDEKPENIQAKSNENATVDSGVESILNLSKGTGTPLPENTKSRNGIRIWGRFYDVRIHTGSDAVQMNKSLGAQAFTHGNDIYFNEGKYNSDNSSGKHLLAHELIHTIQQGASVKPKMVQKVNEPESPITINEVTEQHPSQRGTIEKSGSTVTIFLNGLNVKSNAPSSLLDSLPLPHQLPRSGSRSELPTRQATIWSGAVRSDTESSLENLLAEIETERPMSEKKAPGNLYKLTLKRGSRQAALTGNFTQLKNAALIPSWNRRGETITFQVEHVLDYQIAGNLADNIENLILLESSTNNFLGDVMRSYIRDHINDVLEHYNQYIAGDDLVNSADAARENENYTIKANSFSNVVHEFIADRAFFREDYSPNRPGNPLNPALVELESLTIPPGHFILKTSRTSAGLLLPYSAQNLDVGSLRLTLHGNEQDGLSSIIVTPVIDGNHLEGEIAPETYTVTRATGTHTYTAETAFGRRQIMGGLRLRYLSLMEFTEPQLDDNLNIRAEGRINAPSPGFLNNTPIEISITGKTLSIQKTFSASDLASVGPFSIDYASLALGLKTAEGITASGSVGFSIAGVGSGSVNASASQGNFMLNGNFGFESDKIDGNLEMQYSSASDHEGTGGEGQSSWGIEGTLNLRSIRGIKNATITVGYENQTITGSATSIELDVPGVTVNEISLSYGVDSETFEFTVSAGTSRIPGIQSAEVTVTISSGGNGEDGAGSGDLALNISGSATFRSIPGLQNPTLAITYDSQSGVIDISANVQFERGKVSGSVTVGVTNRQVTDGVAGGEAGEQMNIYGEGQLSITITDQFTPQLGAKLTPEGNILLNGWVNVNLQIGEGYERDRTLFGIDVTPIPIFTIGIAQVLLTAGGSLGVYANINPISIDGRIGFENFNPAVPESFNAVVEATARASASAGLKFDAYLGVMASAAIIYVEGRLVVETRIGAEAGAQISGSVTWNASRGFEINNATAGLDLNLTANASLILHVGAGIYLYVSRVEVLSHDFPIASTDFPPLAQMQVSMPINFENGSLSEINAEDISIRNNPLDNPQAAGRFLQGAVTDVGPEPENVEVTQARSQIVNNIRQYPSIGPANPDYYILYSKQFLVEELKNNHPDEDWSWLDTELANMEYSEFIDFRAYILSQPCSSSRIHEMQMFGINHPSVGRADMSILETELQQQDDECFSMDLPPGESET